MAFCLELRGGSTCRRTCRRCSLSTPPLQPIMMAAGPTTAPGCNLRTADNQTLVATLQSNGGIRTDMPLLIRLLTNVTVGPGLSTAIDIRRPVVPLGLTSVLTSIDLGKPACCCFVEAAVVWCSPAATAQFGCESLVHRTGCGCVPHMLSTASHVMADRQQVGLCNMSTSTHIKQRLPCTPSKTSSTLCRDDNQHTECDHSRRTAVLAGRLLCSSRQ